MSKKKRSDTTKAYNDDVTITSLLRNVKNVTRLLEKSMNSKYELKDFVLFSSEHMILI